MKLYQSNILSQLPMTHRAMITVLRFSGEMKAPQIAKSLSWTLDRKIDQRIIADLKNQINEFSINNDLDFVILSGAFGYKFLDLSTITEDNKEYYLKTIQQNIKTVHSRAVTTQANLKTLRAIEKKLLTRDQIPIQIDENGQYEFV